MPFQSVLSKIKSALGIGAKPSTVIPKSRKAAYTARFGGDTMQELTLAIQNREPVTFFYNDKWQEEGVKGKYGQRVGNPHAIWKGRNGRVYLHMYVDPQSASATGDLPGWRTFLINRIQSVSALELGTSFFGKKVQFVLAPGWNPGWYSRVGTPIVLVK